MGLLVRGNLPGVPHIITMLLYVVIVEPAVLLRLNVLVSVSDMRRIDPVWAVPAVKDLTLIVERQALSLEPDKGAFSSNIHAERYLLINKSYYDQIYGIKKLVPEVAKKAAHLTSSLVCDQLVQALLVSRLVQKILALCHTSIARYPRPSNS